MLRFEKGIKHVFIDWIGVEAGYGTRGPKSLKPRFSPYGIRLKTHRPILEREPVLIPDKKWEQFCVNGYATFLEDEGCIRCWYECFPLPTKDDMTSLLAYAESDDGINWRKPSLKIYDFNGSSDNNILMNIHGASVFKDPKAEPGERYKMVWVDYNRKIPDNFQVAGAVSPDGIAWKRLSKPLMTLPADTQSIADYDEDMNKYILYSRQSYKWNECFGALRRAISRTTTDDFLHWPEAQMVLTNDPSDPPDWDYYTSGYSKWPGAKNAHLMFIDMFHRTRDTFDIHLATSRDGVIWYRPLGQEALIPNGPAGSFNDMMICATKGIISTKDKDWVNYVQCGRNGHHVPPGDCMIPYGGYWRSIIREDGYISLSSESLGEFWSVPVILEGNKLEINANIPYSGSILLEIVDADNGITLEGYEFDDCCITQKNKTWKAVSWRNSQDLSMICKKPVRLHFRLFKSDLFSIRVYE